MKKIRRGIWLLIHCPTDFDFVCFPSGIEEVLKDLIDKHIFSICIFTKILKIIERHLKRDIARNSLPN